MDVAIEYNCMEVRTYIDFLILLNSTPLVSALFCSIISTFCSLCKYIVVFVLV